MPSIKKNFVLNLINTISGLLFPLITFPYASRILLADGIGQVQFFTSIINYIILLTSLGLPLYAIREIARERDDGIKMSKTATEILLLHLLLSAIGYIIVLILICTVSKIKTDIPLFILISTSIIFTTIGVEWFYQGIEDFKYITVRSIIVRTICVIALFVFVKEKGDLIKYAAISVAGTVGNNVFNFIRLHKHLKPVSITELNIWRHLSPSLKVFILNLIISLYVNLDSIMLGFLKDETAVGYYTASIRVSKALVTIIASIGTVLLPRFSNLAGDKMIKELKILANKCVNIIIAIGLPFTIGLILVAKPIIHIFCGYNYEPSIQTLQIMSPIVFFIPFSSICNIQILYSMGKENLSIISTSAGAICNFILNLCLIPRLSQYGAAIATVLAELVVAISAYVFCRKYIYCKLLHIKNYIIATTVIGIFLFALSQYCSNEYIYIILGTSISILLYFGYLAIINDEIFQSLNIKIKKNCQ